MKVYSIKDVKSGFMGLQIHKNDELAIRAYKNLVNDPQPNLVSMNPEDFELWCLGSYDSDSGIISSSPEFVFSAIKDE